ncbi:MAG: VOC family protein [Thermodesulfobacteriota bacterium]
MISRLDHVAVAVHDYNQAIRFFTRVLGAVPGASLTEDKLNFRWEILSVGDLSRLEVLNPAGPGSFLEGFLKDRPGGVHHLTFETPDIQQTKTVLEEHGIPYFGFNDENPAWKELFIHPRDAFGVLIQIAEFEPSEFLDASVRLPRDCRWTVQKRQNGGTLSLSHPGGGKFELDLDSDAVRKLINDLESLL